MTIQPYNNILRALHWTIALLVILQIALGFAADWSAQPLSNLLLDQHVRLGLLVLGLMLLRIVWRLTTGAPPLPPEVPLWQRRAALSAHAALYLLLLLLPVSGYVLWAWIGRPLDWFALFDIPILITGGEDELWRSVAGYMHEYMGYALIALLSAHIGVALWHELVRKDGLISERMGWGGRN